MACNDCWSYESVKEKIVKKQSIVPFEKSQLCYKELIRVICLV